MRYPGLDLLRALAIVWVMLFHSYLVGGLGEDWAWLSRYGWMGVDLFFVLSGFLIGRQVLAPLARGERLAFADFYWRRAFRILPAFWVVLAAYTLFPVVRENPGMEPWWKFATFTVNLWIDYGTKSAFSHAWSLCVEEHFYLVFPVLAWALARRPSPASFLAACVVVVLAGIALRAGMWLHDRATLGPTDTVRAWFVEDIYYPSWNRLDGLLAGVVLAVLQVYRPETWQRWSARAGGIGVLGLAAMALAFWLFRERIGLLGNAVGWPVLAFGMGCLVFAGASPDSWLGRWRVPGAAWLAGISYSLYLVHKATFHLTQVYLGDALEGRGLVAVLAYGGVAIAIAAVLHYTVERPGLRLRARLRPRVHAQTAAGWDAGGR